MEWASCYLLRLAQWFSCFRSYSLLLPSSLNNTWTHLLPSVSCLVLFLSNHTIPFALSFHILILYIACCFCTQSVSYFKGFYLFLLLCVLFSYCSALCNEPVSDFERAIEWESNISYHAIQWPVLNNLIYMAALLYQPGCSLCTIIAGPLLSCLR